MEFIAILPMLILAGIIGGIIGGLLSPFIILYRLSPPFRRSVRQYRERSYASARRIFIKAFVPKRLLKYGLVFLAISASGLFTGLASLIPNTLFHLDVITSLLTVLVSSIAMLFAMGLTITASTIGIIQTHRLQKWK